MNEAIRILENQKDSLKIALSKWESENFPDAKKLRDKKLKEITDAIELIKKHNTNKS